MESPETFNDVIVDNFLSFQMHPHMTYLVKRNQGYHNPKTTRKCGFQQKAGNRYGVGARQELASELSCHGNLVRKKYVP
jgi:hypothetical protein